MKFFLKNLRVKWKKKFQGVVFCQIFRWNSYPETPGTGTGVQKPEPDRNRHFDDWNRIGTANLLPGTPLEEKVQISLDLH